MKRNLVLVKAILEAFEDDEDSIIAFLVVGCEPMISCKKIV